MKCRITILLIHLLLIQTGSLVHGQDIFFNRVMPPEGKMFQHVRGMVQDRDGYMWLATIRGLFRYDGYSMISFNHDPADSNSLVIDTLQAICIGSTGIIWIATQGAGLERFDPVSGKFEHFRNDPDNPASLSSDMVIDVMVDRQGTLWVGTNDGLNRMDMKTGRFTHFKHNAEDPESISSNEVMKIYEDRSGVLWVGTGSVYGAQDESGGLNRFERRTGKFTRYLHDPKDAHSLINNKVRAIYEDSKGNFWIGTAGDGLHIMNRATGTFQRHQYDPSNPEKLSRPPISSQFPRYDHITFITEDAAGAIWIGTTESGLNYYNPETGRIKYYRLEKDTAGSFTERTTWEAYSSNEGVLWISTLHGNLYRVNPFQQEIPFFNIPGAVVNALYEEKDGTVWIGTRNLGLFRSNPSRGTMRQFVYDPGDPGSISQNWVSGIIEDKLGRIWVTTHNGLNLWNREKENFIRYYHKPGSEDNPGSGFIMDIVEDIDRNLWMGTRKGLTLLNVNKLSFSRFIFFPEDTRLTSRNSFSRIYADSAGYIWASNFVGPEVFRFNAETREFKTSSSVGVVKQICTNRDGTIWLSGSKGLFQYIKATGEIIPYYNPVTSSGIGPIVSMVPDNNGNLWLVGEDGIIKINPALNEIVKFGQGHGVKKNYLDWPPVYKARSGKLFIAVNSGYYAFFPEDLAKNLKPPQIVFSDLLFGDRLKRPGRQSTMSLSEDKIKLSHTENIFSFSFTAIDFMNPEENHQYYMLENYDEGWNRAGPDKRAFYFKVPPGKYIFRVKAANSSGLWTEKSVAVTISPPWWANLWFRISAVIIFGVVCYCIIRWRLHQKYRRQLEQSEKEKQLAGMRQKTAELLHQTAELEMQALRAQMNPHFIFNSLNSINRFILQSSKAQASEYLTKFSRLMRLILQNSQATLITLDSELEALRLYLELEALRFDYRFDYNITVSEEVDAESIKVPPLFIQPYAENAIWHGLMHKEETGHLDISISIGDNRLVIRVTDNGIGRQAAKTLASKSATKRKSLGLKITGDRLAMLQEKNETKSAVAIKDLVNPDGSAAGTEVMIYLPVKYD